MLWGTSLWVLVLCPKLGGLFGPCHPPTAPALPRHIDTLPLFPLLPSSHATRLSTVTTEEQAQQHSHR